MDISLQKYERLPDKYIRHKNGFNPVNYISIQDRVNNDPEFEKQYFETLISEGWVKLENNADILYYPKGRTFKYRLNGEGISKKEAGTFRSGGFLLEKPLDSNDYILYKSFNGCIFPLQIADIQEIYVKDLKKEIIKFNNPKEPTNNPVYLPHPLTGENIVVFYGKKPKDSRNFQNTMKFKRALTTGNWKFRD